MITCSQLELPYLYRCYDTLMLQLEVVPVIKRKHIELNFFLISLIASIAPLILTISNFIVALNICNNVGLTIQTGAALAAQILEVASSFNGTFFP